MANEPKPRVKAPKSAKKGEVITIKTLVSHKMETGLRKDSKTGEKIPRQIINRFVVTFNGEEVFSADMDPAISANPYFQFTMKAEESGELAFAWTDDNGSTYTAKETITVN